MKLTKYLRAAFSAVFIIVGLIPSNACGAYRPIIPTPDFFELSVLSQSITDYDRQENLIAWQSLTSPLIPLSDIEEAVYHDSLQRFRDMTGYRQVKTKNKFYNYLNNTNDWGIIDLLETAKDLEEERRATLSPWFYPQDRNSIYGYSPDYSNTIEACKAYEGKRLRDRYSLQICRALFASNQYAACIEYCDSAFADIPDDNLMKRMAQSYVAGCWSRLGNEQYSDSVFAKAGNLLSISSEDRVDLVARLNPNAPQLIDYIRSNADDSTFMAQIIPIAHSMAKDNRVINKGDWYYVLSFVNNAYLHDILYTSLKL